MPDLDEADRTLALAQRFHNAVDAVARQSKHHIHAPGMDGIHEHIRRSTPHIDTPVHWEDQEARLGVTRSMGEDSGPRRALGSCPNASEKTPAPASRPPP